jgi:hypothetical protein
MLDIRSQEGWQREVGRLQGLGSSGLHLKPSGSSAAAPLSALGGCEVKLTSRVSKELY